MTFKKNKKKKLLHLDFGCHFFKIKAPTVILRKGFHTFCRNFHRFCQDFHQIKSFGGALARPPPALVLRNEIL